MTFVSENVCALSGFEVQASGPLPEGPMHPLGDPIGGVGRGRTERQADTGLAEPGHETVSNPPADAPHLRPSEDPFAEDPGELGIVLDVPHEGLDVEFPAADEGGHGGARGGPDDDVGLRRIPSGRHLEREEHPEVERGGRETAPTEHETDTGGH